MGNQLVGTPLAQMFVYCVLNRGPQVIDVGVIRQLLDPTTVNSVYHYHIPVGPPSHSVKVATPLELAILLQRRDVVEVLLREGADIFVTPSLDSPPVVIFEYFEFGTSKILSWILEDYLPLSDIPQFIQKVLSAEILQERVIELFMTSVKRHPAHAVLTCGNQDMIENFLKKYPSEDLLTMEDRNGDTALQVAAKQNNLHSVKILLKL